MLWMELITQSLISLLLSLFFPDSIWRRDVIQSMNILIHEYSFIRLKMHQRVHAKDNSALTEEHYSTLPDFNNNYEHVTIRKTSTTQ